MDRWSLVAVVVGAGAVVIGIPMAFVLRGLSQLSQRTIALAEALQEVQASTAAASELSDLSIILEHPGGA